MKDRPPDVAGLRRRLRGPGRPARPRPWGATGWRNRPPAPAAGGGRLQDQVEALPAHPQVDVEQDGHAGGDGRAMAPATMPPTAPMRGSPRSAGSPGERGAPAENAAEITVNGICSTDEVTSTMRPASSRMPNTRQKLPRTSRQDRPAPGRALALQHHRGGRHAEHGPEPDVKHDRGDASKEARR